MKRGLPYPDPTGLPDEERRRWIESGEPPEFGHTLADQIASQLEAGFVLTGLYEDVDPKHVLSRYIASFIATRAVRPTYSSTVDAR